MALPATEAFTGSNNTDVRTLTGWDGAGSEVGAVGLDIQSNAAQADSSGASGANWWTTDAFNNDHYSTATVTAIASGVYIGVGVRLSGTDNGSDVTGYFFYSDSADGSYIDEYSGGSYVATIAGPGTVFAVNDVIRLEVTGTNLVAKVNGATLFNITDNSIASGAAGIVCNSDGSSRVDNWEGGNMVAATKSPPVMLNRAFRVWRRKR